MWEEKFHINIIMWGSNEISTSTNNYKFLNWKLKQINRLKNTWHATIIRLLLKLRVEPLTRKDSFLDGKILFLGLILIVRQSKWMHGFEYF